MLDECWFQSRLKAGPEGPRMQWALAGAKRLECGSLLPLCLYAQTTCLSPYPIFPISPMTGHATCFDPANRATEHTPVGCGEECPRSCTRWKKQRRRERGRPRPHQPDNRSYDPFRSCKSCARTFSDWGWTNNVSVPMSASAGFLRGPRQSRIGIEDNTRSTPASGHKTQTTQTTSLSLYLCPCWMCVCGRGGCSESTHLAKHSVTKRRSGGGAATLKVSCHAPRPAGFSSALLHRVLGRSEAELC